MSPSVPNRERVHVRLPAELPTITPALARALVAILVEHTETPVLDGPGEEVTDDR